MVILGISCFYHDSAACLLRDGEVVSAAQEERFDRVKGSAAFPTRAINACLQAADLTCLDVDYVAFYEKPFLKFSRVMVDHARAFPFSFPGFLRTMPAWLSERLVLPLKLKKDLGYENPTLFIRHHLAHAASSFLVSPFEEAAILTVDGVGELATTTCGSGRGNRIEINREITYPDSLGLLYTAITTWLGFEANRGEGKVMALAGFGEPTLLERFRDMVAVAPDGSYRLEPSWFHFSRGRTMFSRRFIRAFGPARQPGDEIEDRHRDMAASLQNLLETTLLTLARTEAERTGLRDLCLAGGVALNCTANSRILEETPFESVFIQPAAGDAGTALGAACYVNCCVQDQPRDFRMKHAFLGPEFPARHIRRLLTNRGARFEELGREALVEQVARRIADGEIVGWFQGPMEFGPRALGNRSILADPRNPDTKDILNARVKHREPFRPFGASIPAEDVADYFEGGEASPFMLLAPRVRPGKKHLIPSALHVDGTCRIQAVTARDNGIYHDLIREFGRITGVPLVINTSFNDNNEPIVCTPEDAWDCFARTGMDCLVMGDFVVEEATG